METTHTGTLDEAAGYLHVQAELHRERGDNMRTKAQRDTAAAHADGLDDAVEVLRHWHLPASDSGTVLEEFAGTCAEQGAPPKVLTALTDAAKLVREWQAKPA